jgi:predicted membrane protein (TIGR00267 family)
MSLSGRIGQLLSISGSRAILRRYFVVNGFDGALTMLGIIMGALLSPETSLVFVSNTCLAAAIALGVSGVSSAYVSEVAERKRELDKLEGAMVSDLGQSTHGKAARWVPWLVALVNGAAPLAISLLILTPLWLAQAGFRLPAPPLQLAVLVAFCLIFFLGVLLGKIANVSWVRSGIQTLLVAGITVALIFLLTA